MLMRSVKLANGDFGGGDIPDPNTGYRCNFKLEDGGKTLVVRGYLGVLLERTVRPLRFAAASALVLGLCAEIIEADMRCILANPCCCAPHSNIGCCRCRRRNASSR